MGQLISGLSNRYRTTFHLDEDSLRRIHAVLEKACKELSYKTIIIYHLERIDNRFYETDSIEEVLTDPNIYSKRIKELQIRVEKEEDKNELVFIDFEIEKDIELYEKDLIQVRIISENKNWSLLLADELEPYLDKVQNVRNLPLWILLLYIIPLGFIIYKLTYESDFYQDSNVYLSAVLLLIFLFIFLFGRDKIRVWKVSLLGPESYFLWGDELNRYTTNAQKRNNVFWLILIGFIISFLAGGLWILLE